MSDDTTKMIKWTKPGGGKVETNDLKENVEMAEKLGWTRKGATKPASEKKASAETKDAKPTEAATAKDGGK